MEKRIKYGMIILLFLTIGLSLYGFISNLSGKLIYDGSGSRILAKADFRMAAIDLINVFDTNESQSDHQYLYKTLSVSGVIKKIRQNRSGSYIISLGSRPNLLASVSCSLDSLYNHQHLPLKTGDSATIRGTCAGHLQDVVLVQCIIEK